MSAYAKPISLGFSSPQRNDPVCQRVVSESANDRKENTDKSAYDLTPLLLDLKMLAYAQVSFAPSGPCLGAQDFYALGYLTNGCLCSLM